MISDFVEASWLVAVIVSVSLIVGITLIAVASTLIYFYFFRRRHRRQGQFQADDGAIPHRERGVVGDTPSNWSTASSREKTVSQLLVNGHRGARPYVDEAEKRHRQQQIDNGYFTFPVTKIHHDDGWRQRQIDHRTGVGRYMARKARGHRFAKKSFGRRNGDIVDGRSANPRRRRTNPRRAYTQSLDRSVVSGTTHVSLPPGKESTSINITVPQVLSSGGQKNAVPILQSWIPPHSGDLSIGQSDVTDLSSSSRISDPLITVDGAPKVSEIGTAVNGSVLWNA
ncbi:hypothetical protein LSH36_284g00009 [Paralvinella palmiformis]|uniref:Uncharacterized protein n=1 Tax=Paralvinella palmiformis TaxID=53620 RepID=A0AAD9N3M9_9ANNE|nr:hypothetical protein LSH36_284g00009 [Paralvinella palmiformis]